MFDPQHVITTAENLRRLVPPPRPAQETKVLAALDTHCRRWIQGSPFVVISSVDLAGNMDLSPKGDPPGFVQILDDTTVAIPDRPGNRRLDTLNNLLQQPKVGLMFIVPGRGEVLRVSGTGQIVTDPDLLSTMTVAGRSPRLALVVTIDEVMFHCGKSVIRSKLWSPSEWPDIEGLASYAECLGDQTTSDETVTQMEARFASWQDGNELY
ncbi:MAG: pyridoxamine 5'-phosphate oxidase family protein [Actinomycetota bacterium]|nr:pyridoxamine 5'-phosphate oxidase family protein [Actinomycetota bacterium]MDG2120274.1 pyridoxamine 5'-phosphate oxidase family protein [Actinomycetota bacterium]